MEGRGDGKKEGWLGRREEEDLIKAKGRSRGGLGPLFPGKHYWPGEERRVGRKEIHRLETARIFLPPPSFPSVRPSQVITCTHALSNFAAEKGTSADDDHVKSFLRPLCILDARLLRVPEHSHRFPFLPRRRTIPRPYKNAVQW